MRSYAANVSAIPNSVKATSDRSIVTVSLIFLCFRLLAPILNAGLSGRRDFIGRKTASASPAIFDSSVFLKFFAFSFETVIAAARPDAKFLIYSFIARRSSSVS